MPMDDIPADPRTRLGYARELIRQIADPNSALSLGWTVYGPDHVRERCAEFLAREDQHRVADGIAPATYDPTDVPRRRLIADRTPWPALATCDLWPGDMVTHPSHGAGSLVGFDNDEWPDALQLLAAGSVLVSFDIGERWVMAAELTRTSVSPL